MQVNVRILPPMAKFLGVGGLTETRTFEVALQPNATLEDVFKRLAAQYPMFDAIADSGGMAGKQKLSVMISLNGSILHMPAGLKTVLSDGAEVCLLMPYSGG